MKMSRIDNVQQIVATIRATMAERIKPGEHQARAAKTPSGTQARASSQVQQQQRMSKLVGQRVKALDPDDPKRGRKAFRIFLESVLLSEFGEDLINDPGFYQMVDDVQTAMEQEPQIADAIGKAVTLLLAAPGNAS